MEAHWEAARLADPLDELPSLRRLEGAGGIVHEHPGSAQVAQLMGALEQDLRFARQPGTVHEPDSKLLLGTADGIGGFLEICEVIERVMEAEDVDPTRRGAFHEPSYQVAG